MLKKNNWYVYLLECSDGTYYTGITNDLEKRIENHNKGIASKYTRSRLPVKLLHSKLVSSKSAALKEEYRIKRLQKDKKPLAFLAL